MHKAFSFGFERSITFSKWHLEALSGEIEHLKKNTIFNNDTYYGGILVLKENPIRELLVEALNLYINQMSEQK